MSISIRPATSADAPLILRFITDLAIYEKAEHEVKTDVAGLQATLFAADGPASALIVEHDGQPIGYAVYFYNYSTWLGCKGLYLEDLYISPESRGAGAGKATLQYLSRLAVSEGCGRFEWSVLDWNQPAIDFYQSLGARPQDEWVGYRLTGEALQRLARS
ncbi:GNAT family N-acetyltransferase [Stutzerimonas kirkiae]|uniref:GNAT family N-acetyltransferase n=1 Tax=Stutzerimonas kirkiae TaxID=2211392 RepID=A0A4Q9R7A8_9GAMM|nr:GNAT family N-acetyltransferase [Stutzerimonas kirkiae]TBU96492.1 GNAT family N-acetyltransferase [Stutzerimonas kirkiae]TBV04948.1 GNAT family N-acetyltransferase [Stutzerimonas kirkiae]TBV12372.1 GNAT family N-acetyltransferase [Stutzerimonas kirkiae]TBV12616.1 GNAT family N-acetyltransferase [Stutzerimonas kirkiae]